MDISELTLRLILLFFPGIVCFYVFEALTTPRERKPHQIFLLSLVFGVISYLAYMPIDAVYDVLKGIQSNGTSNQLAIGKPDGIVFLQSLVDKNVKPNFIEIGLVSIVAIFVGFLLSAAANRKWLYDVAQWLKITQRFGDPNVWSLALNSPEVRWATVRDPERNFMYMGYIGAFSDNEDPAELLLYDVTVYNESSGEELYRADRMYISRKRDTLTVEFPNPVPPSSEQGLVTNG